MTNDAGDPSLSDELLDRYFAGQCTPAEEERVRRALGGTDSRPAVRHALTSDDARWSSRAAWASVSASLPRTPTAANRMPRGILRIAAGLVLVVGGATIARRAMQTSSTAVQVRVLTIATARGERREIVLPDSTRVTLAPGSQLRYPEAFGTTRDVQLSGRAYFRVTKNAARPFAVRTNGAIARVLGTEFDVRELGSGDVEVVVAEGRVQLRPSVGGDTSAPVLTAGQLGRLERGGGAAHVSEVRVDDYLAWRDGRLRASAQPLADVASELTRWYDVDIAVDSTLRGRRVSVDLRVGGDASLDDVLRALTIPIGARFTKAGRVITITGR